MLVTHFVCDLTTSPLRVLVLPATPSSGRAMTANTKDYFQSEAKLSALLLVQADLFSFSDLQHDPAFIRQTINTRTDVSRVLCGSVTIRWRNMHYLVKTVVKPNVTGEIPGGEGNIKELSGGLLPCHKRKTRSCFHSCHTPFSKVTICSLNEIVWHVIENAVSCFFIDALYWFLHLLRAAKHLYSLIPTYSPNECHLIAVSFGDTLGSSFEKPFSKVNAQFKCRLVVKEIRKMQS